MALNAAQGAFTPGWTMVNGDVALRMHAVYGKDLLKMVFTGRNVLIMHKTVKC